MSRTAAALALASIGGALLGSDLEERLKSVEDQIRQWRTEEDFAQSGIHSARIQDTHLLDLEKRVGALEVWATCVDTEQRRNIERSEWGQVALSQNGSSAKIVSKAKGSLAIPSGRFKGQGTPSVGGDILLVAEDVPVSAGLVNFRVEVFDTDDPQALPRVVLELPLLVRGNRTGRTVAATLRFDVPVDRFGWVPTYEDYRQFAERADWSWFRDTPVEDMTVRCAVRSVELYGGRSRRFTNEPRGKWRR